MSTRRLAEVDEDEDLAAGAVELGDGMEARAVDDVKSGGRVPSTSCVEPPQEQIAGEEVVPGVLGDDADADAGSRGRRRRSSPGRRGRAPADRPGGGRSSALEAGPPRSAGSPFPTRRSVVARRLADDELVLGRAARCTAPSARRAGPGARPDPHRGGRPPRRARAQRGRAAPRRRSRSRGSRDRACSPFRSPEALG